MKPKNTGAARPARELEIRAEDLFEALLQQQPAALERLRNSYPKSKPPAPDTTDTRQAKTVIARECGFRTWQAAIDAVDGRLAPGDDYGDFWYTVRTDVVLSLWCRNYAEAQQVHRDNGGFLLPFRRQFVVVPESYIEILGLDPTDPDWDAVGHNLAQPADLAGYRRLVYRRLTRLPA